MATEVRCANCGYWLGESAVPLVAVDHVAKGPDSRVKEPRDLRLCKACGRVTVCIPKADLDALRPAA